MQDNMFEKKFKPSISIIRVTAMLSIVFGHICTWQGVELYQLGAIGVEVFLFVSGYLYGKKKIPCPGSWIAARCARVLKPFWICSIFMTVYLVLQGDFVRAVAQMGESLLNIQGLNRLLIHMSGAGSSHISALSHCWFLTIIMICYIITVFIKESPAEKFIDAHPVASLLLAGFIQTVMAYAGIQLSYIIQYFIGYFFCRAEARCSENKTRVLKIATVTMLLACLLRLIANKLVDGTVLYDHVIARQSFVFLGTWICLLVDMTCSLLHKISDKIANSRVWRRLDSLSYSVFLVHYMFMKPPFSVSAVLDDPVLQIFAAMVLTLVSSVILFEIDRRTTVYFRRKRVELQSK